MGKTGFSGSTYKKGTKYTDKKLAEILTAEGNYKGVWNASTNIPAIANGTGELADFYKVGVSGTWNGIKFIVGDSVWYNGSIWQRVATGVESDNPIIVGYVNESTASLPTTRPSGDGLRAGDYVEVKSGATLPFTIGGCTFTAMSDKARYNGSSWQMASSESSTDGISVASPSTESVSGASSTQKQINEENVEEINNKENNRIAHKNWWFNKYKSEISSSGTQLIYLNDLHNANVATYTMYAEKLEAIVGDNESPLDLLIPYTDKVNVHLQSVDSGATDFIVAYDYDNGKKIIVRIAEGKYIISVSEIASKADIGDKVDKTRQVAGKTLENDISIADLINAIKDVARTYTNLSIDCDDNTLTNIVANCFKSGVVLSTITDDITTEEYCFATAKAIVDYVLNKVTKSVRIKGTKATVAEIQALTDMVEGDEWYCQADSHFYLYTSSGWIDAGGATDLSLYVAKADIINNLTTNDSTKPLSAAMGKQLKDEVDNKQDKIEIVDLSDQLEELNEDMTFSNKKLQTFLGMTLANINATLDVAITDVVNGTREIMKVPPLPNGYAYPSQTRLSIIEPTGYHTCMNNKEVFYDLGGEQYVDPNIASGKKFLLYSIQKVAPSEGDNKTYDSNGNEIFIAEWGEHNGVKMLDNGLPRVIHETLEYEIDGTENPDVFALKFSAGTDFITVAKYYDSLGGEHTGSFVELVKVVPTIDKQYIYKSYLMNKMLSITGRNFLVDEQGRLCEYTIKQSEQSLALKAKDATTVVSYFEGLSGEVIITPISHVGSYGEVGITFEPHETEDPETHEPVIDYYSVKTHGSNLIATIILQKSM